MAPSPQPGDPFLRLPADHVRNRLRHHPLRLDGRVQLVVPIPRIPSVSTAPPRNTTAHKHKTTYQRKLSWSVTFAVVHTAWPLVLSFSSYTHACAAPVTLSGAVPLR